MRKQNQSDRCGNGDRPKKSSSQINSTPQLAALLEAFERLAAIEDQVEFHLRFELEYKLLRLNQSTFQKAWKAWQTQRRGGDA